MTKYPRKYRNIYRIEKADDPATGAFYTIKDDGLYGDAALNHSLPEPHFDADWPRERKVYSGEYFGAPTKKAMKMWVVDAHKLASRGLVVRRYRVPSEYVVASKIQCVSPLDKAEKIEEYSVIEFCKRASKKGN